jgi:hypothetical protein
VIDLICRSIFFGLWQKLKDMRKIKTVLVCGILSFASMFVSAQEVILKHSELSGDNKPKGNYTAYESKDGVIYRVGEKITIGFPSSNKTFAFITEGDGIVLPVTPLTASASGQQVEIKSIWIGGNKRVGFFVVLRCKGLTGLSNYSVQIENALSTGEVKSSIMSSDEALAELKKAKDKLDLGLITQEEFDKIKEELAKYIK